MKEVFPNYYDKFKCIANKCAHSCCIGWEIDIDEDTMALYNALDTAMGEKIRSNITGDIPHFVLTDGKKCPFLNEIGLCDIILTYGEDALCDICYLHPRFKNFYSSFIETGLGLACEEAARIILLNQDKFKIDSPKDVTLTKMEKEFFTKREEIFSILCDREKTIKKRFSLLAEKFGLKFEYTLEKVRTKYMALERLDSNWTNELNRLNNFSFDNEIFKKTEFQIPFEQLAVYFIFRHLAGAAEDGEYRKRVKFTLISCYLIGALLDSSELANQEKLIDIVRMYSAEVEYSVENIDTIMMEE